MRKKKVTVISSFIPYLTNLHIYTKYTHIYIRCWLIIGSYIATFIVTGIENIIPLVADQNETVKMLEFIQPNCGDD